MLFRDEVSINTTGNIATFRDEQAIANKKTKCYSVMSKIIKINEKDTSLFTTFPDDR